ncbi:MAG: thiopurine S-methyltransferase [Pseudomonadota bacterium]|nr:thiopurine S-methyltransferase [Pseudomonadota bacterium]MDO7711913.1 thiopurine S-methyltransferase [Pseudomonadota bacterium]
MDAQFWHNKWKNNEIAFHRSNPNSLLLDHLKTLSLKKGSVVFVPLCGKTLDIAWLLSNGYCVAGVELVESAIQQLFSELAMVPKISIEGEIKHYSAQNIDIYVSDIFAVSQELLGPVDAIYDRAALVALPDELRRRYTAHLIDITNKSPQLLIAYHYDQNIVQGPPFSISDEEVSLHYKNAYNLTLVASTNVEGGMKGKCEATENVWLLRNED